MLFGVDVKEYLETTDPQFTKPEKALDKEELIEEIKYLEEIDEDHFDNLNASTKSLDCQEAEYARTRGKIRYSISLEFYDLRIKFHNALEEGKYNKMIKLLSRP